MHTTGVLRGPKISRRHSTYIPQAESVITTAKALPCVSKVVLGEIVATRGGMPRVKCVAVPAGLKVVVRGVRSQQTLFVYTTEPDAVRAVLNQEG